MSTVAIIFYKEGDKIPALEFLDEIPKKASAKGEVKLERLAELGHEMRRPEADLVKNGIYELRWQSQGIKYEKNVFGIRDFKTTQEKRSRTSSTL